MDNRRSYLDTLNAGRARRPAAIEDLNRTLEDLESRFGRAAPEAPQQPQMDRRVGDRRIDEVTRRMQSLSAGAARPEPASTGIAAEMKELRDELRQHMTAGLRNEFDTLRQDIERAYTSTKSGPQGADLTAELEQLSGAIRKLAERSDDRGVGLLRSDLDEVKQALGSLAREDTVRLGNRRWDEFDRRWTAFEEREPQADPAIEALEARLGQINDAVANLPDSLALRSLDDKVRTLASAIDQFSRQHAAPQAFEAIESRLDEISRAIVASSAAAQMPAFNPEPFERIEARIATLARQLEDVADDKPIVALTDRLVVLSDRIAEISQTAELPAKAVERLAQQVSLIAGKLDSGKGAADAEIMLNALEQRFAALTEMIDKRHAEAAIQGKSMFAELDSRIEALSDRLGQRESTHGTTEILDAIDARFSSLSGQIQREADAADPAAIRNLERQIADLSALLAKPSAAPEGLAEVAPRLDKIEQSIVDSRDAVMTAAREAAEGMARNFVGTGSDGIAVAALADDLKSLDALARRSDDRNSRTFEAIHDTLLKVVERLGALDVAPGPAANTPIDRPRLEPSPELDPAIALGLSGSALPPVPRPPARTPAEAAAAAAQAVLEIDADEKPAELAPKKKSVLGGLGRALKRDAAANAEVGKAAPSARGTAPEVSLDAPLDPKQANQPLEPGSGAPDLNAIMKRVRDERGQPVKAGEADAAKSDFIAAARRAAQAAAAEAETLKGKAEVAGRFGIGDLFRAQRKTVLMAACAIMIALAGLQLGKSFLNGDPEIAPEPVAQTDTAAPMSAQIATTEPAAEPVVGQADLAAPATRTVTPNEPRSLDPVETAGAPAAQPMPDDAPAPAQSSSATAASNPIETTSSVPAPVETAVAPAPATPAEPPAVASLDVPEAIGPLPLRDAAAKGDEKAEFEIGSRFADARGVKEDLAAAAKWYEKSAEAGFAPAQYRIGNYYEKGVGVTREVGKAKTWYQLAAAQGNVSAMHNLAVLFAMGVDGPADNESAARWFAKAADLGVKDSQFNLGILAAKGVGMPQNLEESYKWFALVAKGGDKDAAAKRDEIANSLGPDQLKNARAAVELWKPLPADPEANSVEIPDAWNDNSGQTASIDMKQAIRNVQAILNKNGYDAGGADGVMGGKTKTAIAKFQKDNGLDATGEIDQPLVKKLLEKK